MLPYQEQKRLQERFTDCLLELQEELMAHEYGKNPMCKQWELGNQMEGKDDPRMVLCTQYYGEWEYDNYDVMLPIEQREKILNSMCTGVISVICNFVNERHPDLNISWSLLGDYNIRFNCELMR